MSYRRTVALLTVLVWSCAPAVTSEARAAESAVPTAQQRAYGLDWVPFIDPADLPPVEQRKIVCLVDTGVAVTPDLPPDRIEGPIVARDAIDGGSGLPGPTEAHQHGTRMASFAGAVAGNDWGTVGAWPGVRIISVRAPSLDRTAFSATDWRQGLFRCQHHHDGRAPIAAVNFSLGGDATIDTAERARLEEAISRAHALQNLSVVAAAGNRATERLDDPANVAGVFPVAAGTTAQSGYLCSYASYVPGVLVGPACGVNVEWNGAPATTDGGGSSSATVFVSTTIALLRTLYLEKFGTDPNWREAERWLRDSAPTTSGRPALHGESAARLAGLGDVVDRARARSATGDSAPGLQSPDAGAPTTVGDRLATPTWNLASDPLPERLPQPRASVTWRRALLTVRLTRSSNYAETLRVSYSRRARGTRVIKDFRIERRRTHVLRVSSRPHAVRLQLRPYSGDTMEPSRTVTLKPRGGRYR